jgi:hypothetical protein
LVESVELPTGTVFRFSRFRSGGTLPSSWPRDPLLLCVACFVVFAA